MKTRKPEIPFKSERRRKNVNHSTDPKTRHAVCKTIGLKHQTLENRRKLILLSLIVVVLILMNSCGRKSCLNEQVIPIQRRIIVNGNVYIANGVCDEGAMGSDSGVLAEAY
jgi:hypothetical protein